MQAEQPSPEEKLPYPDKQTAQQKLLGYQRGIQGIREQLQTENDLRKVADSVIIEGFITELTGILSEVKKLPEDIEPLPKGIHTFCRRMEDAIFRLYAAQEGLKRSEQKFDANAIVQSFDMLRMCGEFLDLVLEQFWQLQLVCPTCGLEGRPGKRFCRRDGTELRPAMTSAASEEDSTSQKKVQ